MHFKITVTPCFSIRKPTLAPRLCAHNIPFTATMHGQRPQWPANGHNHPMATANPDQLATIKPATIGHARQTLGLPLRKPKKAPKGL
jgi:hypothetical protein